MGASRLDRAHDPPPPVALDREGFHRPGEMFPGPRASNGPEETCGGKDRRHGSDVGSVGVVSPYVDIGGGEVAVAATAEGTTIEVAMTGIDHATPWTIVRRRAPRAVTGSGG